MRRVRMSDGPLAGVRVRVRGQSVIRIPGAGGRYIEDDGIWFWEVDHV